MRWRNRWRQPGDPRCTVLRIGNRVWHWHKPRKDIVNCTRATLVARTPPQPDDEP